MRVIHASLTRLGVLAAHPAAFLVVVAFAVLWIVFDRATLGWHGVAALLTLFMTLLIQRAEHRDTQAIHAKLDELLRASSKARNELASLDDKEPEAIEQHRERAREGERSSS
jgi:low affinity Fe/Cu permease